MNRTDIINFLIKQNNFKSYLEIGLDTGENFRKINCELKESVDPFFKQDHQNGRDLQFGNDIPNHIKEMLTYRMTSDEFFDQNTKKYDIIFIDGLHLQEQVGKDIINAMKILNENGKIVVHDCLPENEMAQVVPRQVIGWNGDVWKAMYELIDQGLSAKVVNVDCGVGVIDYTNDDSLIHYPKKSSMTWNDFAKNRDKMMNVISENAFLNTY